MAMYSSRTQGALRELAAITRQYQSVAEEDRKTASSPIRHKVFVSYHAVDAVEVVVSVRRQCIEPGPLGRSSWAAEASPCAQRAANE